MPIQTPQWTDFLICPVCENAFELKTRLPVSLACGHSVCKTCLANLQRNVCPFDQVTM
jgi:RING finger/CCCH-type zinc finger protein